MGGLRASTGVGIWIVPEDGDSGSPMSDRLLLADVHVPSTDWSILSYFDVSLWTKSTTR